MTPVPRTLPRRTVLAASGTAVLAAAAACSSNSPAVQSVSSAASSAASSAKEAVTAAASSAKSAASSAAGSAKSAASSAASSVKEQVASAVAPAGTVISSVADVTAAGSVVVNAPSGRVLLASDGGTVVCHSAICTHQGCEVAANGDCPCHGSKFNITTGAVENGPAQQPLAKVAVTVSGGQIYAT